jgi:predicted ribosomally synthesized peptide with nif11-like leader
MGLDQLDAFLAYARQRPELQRQLQDQSNPLDLADFLALALGAGFELIEADVIAAQVRQDEQLSDAELQEQAAREARRMRNFIRG